MLLVSVQGERVSALFLNDFWWRRCRRAGEQAWRRQVGGDHADGDGGHDTDDGRCDEGEGRCNEGERQDDKGEGRCDAGEGRETSVRALEVLGLDIVSVKDITPIPHNGCRPPKRRRV